MSVIEKTARAIQLANCNKPIGGIIEDDTWQFYIPLAKAALQCLSDNIDEGGLEAAIEIHQQYVRAQIRYEYDLEKIIGATIRAYLNTISKEPS